MKKILSLILICLMLPVAGLLLSGCGSNHDVRDFYTKYKNIANSSQNLHLVEATDTYNLSNNSYKIDINYSISPELSTLVEDSDSEYYYLKYFYQQLLDDSLAPLYFFGEPISKSSKVSDKQADKLFNHLSKLKKEYEDVDYYLGILITSLNVTDDPIINLSYLKKVYTQYEETIISASKLSAVVCDVYFNTVLSNANINYSKINYTELTDADLSAITVSTRARLYYYKSIYANIYTQLYIRNSELSEELINGSGVLPAYTPYTYIASIKSIENKSIQYLRSNKQEIHTLMISLYNIQKNIEKAYKSFITATNKVAYLDLNATSSLAQINYGKMISNFVDGIAYDSYEVIRNLMLLLYN